MVAHAMLTSLHRLQQRLHFTGTQEILGAFVPIGCATALTFDVLPFCRPTWHGSRPLKNWYEGGPLLTKFAFRSK
jgi:hypothetical protein